MNEFYIIMIKIPTYWTDHSNKLLSNSQELVLITLYLVPQKIIVARVHHNHIEIIYQVIITCIRESSPIMNTIATKQSCRQWNHIPYNIPSGGGGAIFGMYAWNWHWSKYSCYELKVPEIAFHTHPPCPRIMMQQCDLWCTHNQYMAGAQWFQAGNKIQHGSICMPYKSV